MKNCNVVTWFWSNPSGLISHPVCYKAVPTRHLQCISSFSSNDFTRWLPSVAQKLPNFSGQPVFLYLSADYHVLAVASIPERWLFRLARPAVRRQFESGDQSRAASDRANMVLLLGWTQSCMLSVCMFMILNTKLIFCPFQLPQNWPSAQNKEKWLVLSEEMRAQTCLSSAVSMQYLLPHLWRSGEEMQQMKLC